MARTISVYRRGLFVLYLAYGTYKSWKGFDPPTALREAVKQRNLLKAAWINILNPNPYLFWTLVTGPILLRGWRESPAFGVGLIANFYLTMVLTHCAIVIVFGSAQHLGPKVNRMLLGIAVVALFCFGLYQLWLGMTNHP